MNSDSEEDNLIETSSEDELSSSEDESEDESLESARNWCGKGTTFHEDYGVSTKSVLTLIHELKNKGYTLTTDNYYTSPELAEILIKCKTDIYGTLRANRKGLPPLIKSSKVKKGEVLAFQKGKICLLKWTDKKLILMLRTLHSTSMVTVESKKSKSSKLKPTVVADYNNTMGGVDKADQCLSYYPVLNFRKSSLENYRGSVDVSYVDFSLDPYLLHP
ncbi:hypothetical protein AVEN_66359-1 [Araneus ventricosus]|uniref:PiggyBac transposable element-derived protein domain-containing protein n=1 Tax=Araneus ventricosus TaxID=182803 RepID=A0A4Y2VYS8_ARAVE|nr:hypothetical protein AVEN_66359-1 [Araneus ventricosus]